MPFTIRQLQEVLTQVHAPEEAKKEGMVYQVWEDGEVTCQKSGSLLWQRTLHSFSPGVRSLAVDVRVMPCQTAQKDHGYAFCRSEEDAMIIRNMIFDLER